ncbi:MAG: carbonic anhydrase [Promethearchaeota archaeon]
MTLIKDIEQILMNGNLRYQYIIDREQEGERIIKTYPKYPVLILTCMDPRIDIYRIFQLDPGDVFVLRNAGNIHTLDTMRAILLTIANYNIKFIIVLGHLNCRMAKISLSDLRLKLPSKFLSRLSPDYSNLYSELRNFFKPFSSEIQNVVDQIKRLETIKDLYPEIQTTGMLYDTETGWIFNYQELNDFLHQKNFIKRYEEKIQAKNQQLTKFYEENNQKKESSENLIEEIDIIEKKEIKENDIAHTQIEQIQHPILIDDIGTLLKMPKVQIPKIYIPKVKIYKPKIKTTVKI